MIRNELIEYIDNSDIFGKQFGVCIKYRCRVCGGVTMIANTVLPSYVIRPGGIPIVPFNTRVDELRCPSCHSKTKYTLGT